MDKKRLIDAYALKNALGSEKIRIAADKGKMYFLIDTAPTVDAVEVVHGRWIDMIAVRKELLIPEAYYCSV